MKSSLKNDHIKFAPLINFFDGIFLLIVDITCLGKHSDAPQLLGDQALHDPLEGLLHLDDVVLIEHQALLPEYQKC